LQEFQSSTRGGVGFLRLVTQYNTVGSAVVGKTKYSTVAPSPVLDESAPVAVTENQSRIPAQDIQVNARCSVTAVSATQVPTILTVHSYWAPNVHVRPDWLTRKRGQEAAFLGDETGGK